MLWKNFARLTLLASCVAASAEGAVPAQPSMIAAAQWKVASTDPDHPDDADLQPFADAIGNARVVGLGEQTHGAREEYQLKLRLLKYLHRKLGFDVVLLDSGFYDIGELSRRAERGEKLDAMAPGNVFFMYARSAEGRALLHYLDRQRAAGTPMALAGIDSQHTGELSKNELIPRMLAYLALKDPANPNAPHAALARGADWEVWSASAKALFSMDRKAPAAPARAAFLRHAVALDDALCNSADTEFQGAAWWCLVARSVHAQALSYWSADHDYQRDNQMGANAIWLADHLYAGKKIVVWAHTVHLARGLQRTPVNLQAGEVMHRHWGSAYKVVQFSSGGGEILDFVSGKPLAVPAPSPDSLERRLAAQRGPDPSVVGLSARTPVNMAQFSYEYLNVGARLGVNWDVLFYIPKVSPVSMAR